jgi:SAM-dependent methyltransferase
MASKRFETIDWYDTPRYYDIVFDAGTRQEADFLEAVDARHGLARAPGRAARVLEPACGSGRLVLELARRGWSVTGFDRNERMLAFARERLRAAGAKARLVRADLADFRFAESFRLAHCLVSTFKYLLDERSARAHLELVAGALEPGGVYVLGLHLSAYDERRRQRERWVEKRGATKVVCNTQVWPPDRARRLEAVRTRLVVREGGRELRSETRWDFRTYDARELRALLRSVPAFEHVATYDFRHRIDRPRELDDEQQDCALVLRRR